MNIFCAAKGVSQFPLLLLLATATFTGFVGQGG